MLPTISNYKFPFLWGEARLSLFGTLAIVWPVAPAPDDNDDDVFSSR
jgi:hypothetical protein